MVDLCGTVGGMSVFTIGVCERCLRRSAQAKT